GAIQKVAIPERLVLIAAIGADDDRRHARIRTPDQPPQSLLMRFLERFEHEGGILAVERMVVPAGQQGPHAQRQRLTLRPGTVQPPGQPDSRPAMLGDDLMDDRGTAGDAIPPPRPWIGVESFDALIAVRMDGVG